MCRMEGRILCSKLDGLELSVLVVRPEGEPCCVLQLVHGMSEYKERYLPLMEYLAGHGIACVIHDHRGHGKSMLSPEDKGYLYGVGGDGLVEDTRLVWEYAAQQFPDKPIAMLGHSMGSLVARCFLKTYDDCLSALILSGPPTQNAAARAGLALARLQCKVKGPRSKGRLLQYLSFGGYYKKFPASPCAWVCANPETVEQYEEDPLCGFTFRADGFVGLMELMVGTYQKKGWRVANPELPIRALGGEDDPCIGGKGKLEDALFLLNDVGYRQVSGHLYPGLRHEICNEQEEEQQKVFQDILAFLEECVLK